MRKHLLALLGATAVLQAAAEPPPMILYDGGKEEIKITPTGRVDELPDAEGETGRATDPASLAAAIALKGRRFVWLPGENLEKASGGAAIADAALSGDRSVLAVLETIGRRPGPLSSRIVFINTANGTVLRVFTMPEAQRCTRLLFDGDSTMLLLETAQNEYGQNAVRRFDLNGFRPAAEPLLKLDSQLSDLTAASDGTLFGKYAGSPRLMTRIGDKVTIHNTRAPGGVLLAVSPDTVLNGVKGSVERYRLINGELIFERAFKLPETLEPAFMIRIGQNCLLAGKQGEKAAVCFLDGTAPLELEGDGGGTAVYDEVNRQVIMPLEKNLSLGFFNLPASPKPVTVTRTNQMRPKSRGEIIKLFIMPGEKLDLLAFDDRANVFKLSENKKRRLIKELLLSPLDK